MWCCQFLSVPFGQHFMWPILVPSNPQHIGVKLNPSCMTSLALVAKQSSGQFGRRHRNQNSSKCGHIANKYATGETLWRYFRQILFGLYFRHKRGKALRKKQSPITANWEKSTETYKRKGYQLQIYRQTDTRINV